MDTSQAQAYIKQCQLAGFDDQQVRQQLQISGWSDEVIAQLLPISPIPVPVPLPPESVAKVAPAQPQKRRKKFTPILAGLAVLLVLLSGSVAMAEYGYLSGFSKTYRRINLPVLWGGTVSNPSYSLGKMVIESLEAKVIRVEANQDLTIEQLNPNVQVTMDDLYGFSLLKPGAKERKLAVVESDSESEFLCEGNALLCGGVPDDSASDPFADFEFPLTLRSGFSAAVDSEKNTEGAFTFDLKELFEKVPLLSLYLNQEKTELVIENRIFPNQGNGYFRSNALPILESADLNKWFKYSIPEEDAAYLKGDQINQLIDSDQAQFIITFINTVAKDQGVVRRNGEAAAWYQMKITPAEISQLASLPELEQYQDILNQYGEGEMGDFILTVNFYLQPQSARLLELSGSLIVDDADHLMRYTLNFANQFSYGKDVVIEPVAEGETHSQPFMDYLMDLFSHPASELADTGLFSDEALDLIMMQVDAGVSGAEYRQQVNVRKNDLYELDKAMQGYYFDDSNPFSLPISTNGKYDRLDQANCLLCANQAFTSRKSLPIFDPEPDRFYYSYWSDGLTYRFVAVRQDEETGIQNGYYIMENGEITEVDTLP